MSTIAVQSPPLIFVGWNCRRCGHTGGVARTTVPIPVEALTEPVVRQLLEGLRNKLVKVHQRESFDRGQVCVASPSDFDIVKFVPETKTQVGVL